MDQLSITYCWCRGKQLGARVELAVVGDTASPIALVRISRNLLIFHGNVVSIIVLLSKRLEHEWVHFGYLELQFKKRGTKC